VSLSRCAAVGLPCLLGLVLGRLQPQGRAVWRGRWRREGAAGEEQTVAVGVEAAGDTGDLDLAWDLRE